MARDNGGINLVWFTAGAAIGATIALLYAPQTGKETRRYLNKKTREGRDVLSDAGGDLADKAKDMFEKGRRMADDAADLFERGRKIIEG
ncbi:MAG: YtxH domain-containing protein [Bryobacteraceae bacterium]|jgi:gas vesicle protein